MAKQMVYFNATKQIETLTIHYNSKLDGTFVEEVAKHIKEIAKKMSRVDLKNPKEFEYIKVFVYPSKKLFNSVFIGEIEKRYYSRRRSLEDLYVVRDSEGNIHIVSPRGMEQEKKEALKKILVMKVLGEYMDDKQKTSAERLLKEAMKPKEEEIEIVEEEEIEQVEDEIQEEPEEIEEEIVDEEQDEQEQEIEEVAEEEIEQDFDEFDEEEVDEIIETQQVMDEIDSNESEKLKENIEAKKEKSKERAREWLNLGWLAFVKGKLKKEEDVRNFADNISKKGVKKLGDLYRGNVFESYNYSEEYACAIVEYIVATYGMKKFTEFYENPKNIKGVFGVTKYVFEGQVKAYIKDRYGKTNMINEMEDMALANTIYDEYEKDVGELNSENQEITEAVYFPKNGGAEFEKFKPIEEIEIKERI